MTNYYIPIRINWSDPKKLPLEFIGRFTYGWPDYWSSEDFTRKITEEGGLRHKGTWYPRHTIENIEFGEELDKLPEGQEAF